MTRRGKLIAIVLAVVWPASALADAPWSHEISPTVAVNGHTFHRVKVSASGCTAHFQLFFKAPEEMYADKKNLVRNFYRFLARVRVGDHKVDSGSFVNRAPGERYYGFEFDSTAEAAGPRTSPNCGNSTSTAAAISGVWSNHCSSVGARARPELLDFARNRRSRRHGVPVRRSRLLDAWLREQRQERA
jgi:hypothetical protein